MLVYHSTCNGHVVTCRDSDAYTVTCHNLSITQLSQIFTLNSGDSLNMYMYIGLLCVTSIGTNLYIHVALLHQPVIYTYCIHTYCMCACMDRRPQFGASILGSMGIVYIHKCIHAYMHKCIDTYIHKFIHAYIHIHLQSAWYTYINVWIHTHTYIYI
jgi:hypothetical protein